MANEPFMEARGRPQSDLYGNHRGDVLERQEQNLLSTTPRLRQVSQSRHRRLHTKAVNQSHSHGLKQPKQWGDNQLAT